VTLALDYTQDRQATGIVWSFLPGAVGVDDKTTYVGFHNTASNLDNHWIDRNYGASLRVEHDFGWSRLVTITGARDSLNIHALDQDATPLHLIDANPLPQLDKTLTEELQLHSPVGNEKFKWIVGLYYMDDRFASLPLVINEGHYGLGGPTYTRVDVYVREPTRSYAEFGQATWEFLPDTHFTLGVRNTDDSKSIGGNTLINGFDAVQRARLLGLRRGRLHHDSCGGDAGCQRERILQLRFLLESRRSAATARFRAARRLREVDRPRRQVELSHLGQQRDQPALLHLRGRPRIWGYLLTRHASYLRRCVRTKILTGAGEMEDPTERTGVVRRDLRRAGGLAAAYFPWLSFRSRTMNVMVCVHAASLSPLKSYDFRPTIWPLATS
jgi:hypothetical protein